MKIQLRGQSMRLRIDEGELDSLLNGNGLVNVTALGTGVAYEQVLRLGGGDQARLDAAGTNWTLHLPREHVQGYVSRLPCREGLTFTLLADESDALNITFEVDVRDSIRVRGMRSGVQKCVADPVQLT
ncbi:MAG: hypothetical protein KGL55_01390 [Rhodospirillales bacterium]|nr:hypothetical protein [Rhodospirillales bacterium]